MAPSAAGTTSVCEIAIGVPNFLTGPSSLEDFEIISLPPPTTKSVDEPPEHQELSPSLESRANVEQVDTRSSITYLEKDTPSVLDFGDAAGGPSSSSSSSAATQRSSLAPYKREMTPEREGFNSMRESPSKAASPSHASTMSRSAIVARTSPPSVPQAVRNPIAPPAPVQLQAGANYSSSQDSTGHNVF